jgi:thiamine-monophosphate kinase
MSEAGLRLSDLGERRIIEDIFTPRYAREGNPYFGNDCAILESGADKASILVVTTDPAPPAVALQCGFPDLYFQGWLLSTANLSDIAAAGAAPVGLVTSLILPADLRVVDLERLLDGIDDCCRSCATAVYGGNIRDGKSMVLSATAIGKCAGRPPLSRRGARLGDRICVIGDLGLFWAGTLAARRGLNVPEALRAELFRNLLTPMPKVAVGRHLRERGLLTACLDNSDGLYASVLTLARNNGLGVRLNLDDVDMPEAVRFVSQALDVSPVRLALGWGDWQLLVTVAPSLVNELRTVARADGTHAHVIGEMVSGEDVMLEYHHEQGRLLPLDSERFASSSWFLHGLDSYEQTLLTAPLIQPL